MSPIYPDNFPLPGNNEKKDTSGKKNKPLLQPPITIDYITYQKKVWLLGLGTNGNSPKNLAERFIDVLHYIPPANMNYYNHNFLVCLMHDKSMSGFWPPF